AWPCSHSSIGFSRWLPVCRKPSAVSAPAVSGCCSSTPSSTKSMPDTRGAGGALSSEPGGILPRWATASSTYSRDRRASRALRSALARRKTVLKISGDIPRTLTGPDPVMPAPLEDVHRHLGRVRELDKEDLLARDVTDAARIEPTRKHMEGVLTGTQRRVVDHPHDLPRAAVVPDVSRPGQGLERDPHAALVCQLGGL